MGVSFRESSPDRATPLATTNDNLEALRFYQRRGFVLSALRPGAVDDSRRRLKPQGISAFHFVTKSSSSFV
jgi:hypothetical protein